MDILAPIRIKFLVIAPDTLLTKYVATNSNANW